VNFIKKQPFLVYLAFFYVVWGVYNYFISIYLSQYPILIGLIKSIIWLVPLYFYIKYVEKAKFFDFIKLKYNRDLFQGLGIGLLAIVVLQFSTVSFLGLNWNLSIDDVLNGVIVAGIVEEIVFRGFIFQKLSQTFDVFFATFVNAILFVVIHFPYWFSRGLFSWEYCIFIFLFSIVVTIIFKLGKSSSGSILYHLVNNLISNLR